MNWRFSLSRQSRSAAGLCMLFVIAYIAFAQTSTTGAIRGTVTDPSGAVISGATVTVTSLATSQVRTVKTDQDGQYAVGLLPPENYKVSIESPGFKKDEQPPITVTVTETARSDARLIPGNVGEVVEVTTTPPSLQVENATMGAVVDGGVIKELPLTNRNYTQVLTLAAGITGDLNNAATLGTGSPDVYVKGARRISNNFHMDGA